MQGKRCCQVMAAVLTVLALVIFIPVAAQTAASDPTITVYKTPT